MFILSYLDSHYMDFEDFENFGSLEVANDIAQDGNDVFFPLHMGSVEAK